MSVSIRYIVDDVDAAVAFYTKQLGFAVAMHPGPGFAMLTSGDLKLMLNKPGGGGGAGRAVTSGAMPAPGGWNRFQIEVADLEAKVAELKRAGNRFRGEIIVGNGGKQILLDDPSGNAIELFEPAPRS